MVQDLFWINKCFFKVCDPKMWFHNKKFWPKRAVSSDETWEPSNIENPLKWLTNNMHQTKSG